MPFRFPKRIRKIDGLNFYWYDYHTHKSNATHQADLLRSTGRKVRVIETRDGYMVVTRPKAR